MTEAITTNITCPKCDTASAVEIWVSVNSAESPDEAQWLIDGFLFEHTCPTCGNVMTLNHDCLLHDPAHKTLVQLVADKHSLPSAESALEEWRERGYRTRIVGTREALREKAALLRDGLDDRAVELCKFLIYNKFVEEGKIDSTRSAYYGALAENNDIIVEFIGGGEPLETTIPRDVYDGAIAQMGSLAIDDPDPLVVDRRWIASIYDKLG